jgi:preprotein translocase subunit SecY
MREEAREVEPSAELWRAAIITLGVLGALQGLEYVWLPLVDGRGFSHEFAPGLLRRHVTPVTIGALGISPLVSGFLTVEVVAWLVPRWRWLRLAGPRQRKVLDRASVILSVVLAAFQGFSICMYLESLSGPWCDREFCDAVLEPGWGFRCLVILTVTATTCVYWIAAQTISRWGLGAGFSVLVGWTSLKAAGDGIESALRAKEPFEHARFQYVILLLALVAILTWLVTARLRAAKNGSDTAPAPRADDGLDEGPNQEPAHPVTDLPMRALPAGILPFAWASTAVNLPLALANAFRMAPSSPALMQGGIGAGLEIVFVGIFSVVLAGWFYHVPDVAAVHARASRVEASEGFVDAVGRRVVAAVHVSVVVFLAIAVLVAFMTPPRYPTLRVVLIAPVVAVLLDLAAEWRARLRLRKLVVVGTTHWVYVADIAVQKLERAGINAHARSVHHRTLLHFFGPYVPIEICVATEAAATARELAAATLASPVSARARSRRVRTAPTP